MNSDLGVVIKCITWTAGERLENMLLNENCKIKNCKLRKYKNGRKIQIT